MNSTHRILIAIPFIVLLAGVAFWQKKNTELTASPTSSPTIVQAAPLPAVTPEPTPTYQTLKATDFLPVASVYNYQAQIPTGWKVDVQEENESVNIYDPAAEGINNLGKSQIFIRYFKASTFLTLSTVTIHERVETTASGRPAVRYVIEKKAGVPNFANQPSWRNEKHTVTDIRSTDNNPTYFYVVAKRPGLSEEIYSHFLQNIALNP
ncbi:MAG TPA: hypothetical protein VLA04_03225 [Verrucomicrobiae bacterium]|nr:hypothetical protein [Verrucomicrobiae bacterium]